MKWVCNYLHFFFFFFLIHYFFSLGPTLAQEFNDLYISLLDTNTAPLYENIKDIFDYLSSKQIKMGLLSNASLDYVVKVRTTHEMEHLFPSYHGADSVPKPKPHGDGILHVLKELEIEHEAYHKNTSTPCVCSKIVYIGDSPSDGKAAKAANVLSIGVSWGSHPLENIQDHFDYIVNTPIELLDLLTKINENGHE